MKKLRNNLKLVTMIIFFIQLTNFALFAQDSVSISLIPAGVNEWYYESISFNTTEIFF